ncbi:MAG: hypothetical protein JNM07_12205 [Phycisphaerae bacterium]|nr:hypothetical protein [Phycisphaerae bacterium]
MTPRPTISLRAHAKVNLALSVGPPDGRGYHPIASWMVPLDLHDALRIERLPDGCAPVLERAWAADAPKPAPFDWDAESDLTLRALRRLESHIGRALPARLVLCKRTPVGGGLGGGSSDAAAALVGLNALFQLGLGAPELRALAFALGSDIPFFIDKLDPRGGPAREPCRPALVAGLGDAITRLAPPTGSGAPLLLLLPPFGCPTGAVYKAYDRLGPRALDAERIARLAERARAEGSIDSGSLFNDLAAPAETVAPELPDLRRRAAAVLGVPVLVTGSGSTLFALPAETREGRRGTGEAGAGQRWARESAERIRSSVPDLVPVPACMRE